MHQFDVTVLFFFFQWWLLAKKLSLLALALEYTAWIRMYTIYVLSFLLHAHSLRSTTSSSSTARRTIDVTCKPINRKKSKHLLTYNYIYRYIYIYNIYYILTRARTSEQGLSFFPVSCSRTRSWRQEETITCCSINNIKLQ
jgi:hypothetical protein